MTLLDVLTCMIDHRQKLGGGNLSGVAGMAATGAHTGRGEQHFGYSQEGGARGTWQRQGYQA